MSHLLDRLRGFIEELHPLTVIHDQTKPAPRQALPSNIAKAPLKSWDKAVFASELVSLNIVPPLNPVKVGQKKADESNVGDGQVQEGTYSGTKLALTEMYDRIERGYISYFDAMSIENTIPQTMPFEEKQSIYQYQPPGKDNYPPHLDVIPTKDQTVPWKIFNAVGLLDAASLLPKIVPDTFLGDVGSTVQSTFLDVINGEPWRGPTIADVERRNKYDKQSGTDIERGANIGDLPDWYSDARFAQQQFTGTNPTTITRAPDTRISEFKTAANAQGLTAVVKLLTSTDPKDLYIQDCSYFREACGYQTDDVMIDEDKLGNRFSCAAVSLFHLNSDGQLHPLAICTDYKVSMEKSVVIFNKRSSPSDSTASEKEDWPWRYAKTCAQVSDWTRHEITVHLTDTHFMEEVIIVATHRCIPVEHPVFKLLEPHWLRTLSLNAAARETLVPKIIFDLVGVPNGKLYGFLKNAFQSFDFQGKYIPKDLPARGFPLEELNNPKFKNYAYGKNMILMWNAIHTFVSSMIAISYKSDSQVASDAPIRAWCHEIRSPTAGQMPSFPTISTIPALIDAITMCIHIAAPQHTAVNYLQDFYQAFVINKPPSLLSPPPPPSPLYNPTANPISQKPFPSAISVSGS